MNSGNSVVGSGGMKLVEKACRKKVRFDDANEAHRTARKNGKAKGLPLRSYRCPVCHGWHITKAPKR